MPASEGRRRRRAVVLGLGLFVILVGAWVLCASHPGGRVAGCPDGCATAGERRPGPLRVISLNMLHGFPRFEDLAQRLDLIAQEIRAQDADIVCLQEVPWTLRLGSAAAHLAEETGLNYLYLRANGNRWAILFEEGEVILSRFPMRDIARVELAPSAGYFEHRVALRATVITPWGDLPVAVTHLTNGDPAVNYGQAASLLSFVAEIGDGPALVTGDFNAQAEAGAPGMSPDDSILPPALTDRWLDTYRAVSADGDGFTCCVDDLHGGPGEPLEKRIDYLFLVPDSGIRVVDSQPVFHRPYRVEGGWQWASDHTGLLVTFEMSPVSQDLVQP
jgi:endonuclease/exonuclease/phosphatase family metal-dependent hydrolase